MLRIVTIIGSTRQGRSGDAVGRWFAGVAEGRDDLRHELVDLAEWDLPSFESRIPPAMGAPSDDPLIRRWAATVATADGFVMVTPEYNHGYPAPLKNAIDHLYAEWRRKPVAFVGYGGRGGGIRAVEQLRQVVVELEMVPLRHQVTIDRVHRALGDDGRPREPHHTEDAVRVLDDLVWWAEALAAARAEPLQAHA